MNTRLQSYYCVNAVGDGSHSAHTPQHIMLLYFPAAKSTADLACAPPPLFVMVQFVAKRYKKPVDRTVYFADVVLQMDAKFLGRSQWDGVLPINCLGGQEYRVAIQAQRWCLCGQEHCQCMATNNRQDLRMHGVVVPLGQLSLGFRFACM